MPLPKLPAIFSIFEKLDWKFPSMVRSCPWRFFRSAEI